MNKKGKMKDEHNLDRLFREGMEEVDIPFREEDWMAMSEKLDQQDKKSTFPIWWSVLTAAAASILIFFVFFNAPKKVDTVKRIEKSQKPVVSPKNLPVEMPVAQKIDKQPVGEQQLAIKQPVITKGETLPVKKNTEIRILQPVHTAITLRKEYPGDAALVEAKINQTALAGLSFGKFKPTEKELQKLVEPQRLSFTVMAAPDISSTSSSINNKVSTDVGLLVNYAMTKRIGLSTGIIYAKKLYDYNSNGRLVNGYVGTDWSVQADCKVLDLPININYRVFNKGNVAFNASAGISSYLMLNEKYQLTSGPTSAVSNETVTGNKHFFGVANLSVSVERKVNANFSIGLQPFIKLPLTGIGKYEGNLSSVGLSVLLNVKGFDRINHL